MSLGPGNYTFKKIHIDTHHYSGCLTVEKWYENDSGIEVKTKEAGALFLSEGQYALIEDECPFCNANNDTDIVPTENYTQPDETAATENTIVDFAELDKNAVG